MTNYEWLVKTDKLEEFLRQYSATNRDDDVHRFYVDQKISPIPNSDFEHTVTIWLQAEHKPIEYIPLDEAIHCVNVALGDRLSAGDWLPLRDKWGNLYSEKIELLFRCLPIKEIIGDD